MQVHVRPALGNVVIRQPVASQPVVFTRAQIVDRRVAVAGHLAGGLMAATSLILFATGKDKAGYMLGVASALWGAVSGAIRVYAKEQER